MNPFDLAGPQFLAFYVVLAIVVCVALHVARNSGERVENLPRLRDPYAIALLRSGRAEAVRTAMVSLLERRLLEAKGTLYAAAAAPQTSVPLERAILAAARGEQTFDRISRDSAVIAALDTIEAGLRGAGLLPGAEARQRRWRLGGVATALVAGVAITKIIVALSRGRTNVLFLVILACIATFVVVRMASRRRTKAGDDVLSELSTLLAPLKGKVARTKGAAENPDYAVQLALLAGVFGGAALPSDAVAAKMRLFPPQATASSGGGCGAGATCGSSSSSGGSSCGGGCGGGGCGGCGG